jgi:hypothetical protein
MSSMATLSRRLPVRRSAVRATRPSSAVISRSAEPWAKLPAPARQRNDDDGEILAADKRTSHRQRGNDVEPDCAAR